MPRGAAVTLQLATIFEFSSTNHRITLGKRLKIPTADAQHELKMSFCRIR